MGARQVPGGLRVDANLGDFARIDLTVVTDLTAEAAPAVVARIVATVLIVVAEVVNRGMSGRGNPVRPGMMTQMLLFSQRSWSMLRQTS
jgi:hypothetical protein